MFSCKPRHQSGHLKDRLGLSVQKYLLEVSPVSTTHTVDSELLSLHTPAIILFGQHAQKPLYAKFDNKIYILNLLIFIGRGCGEPSEAGS